MRAFVGVTDQLWYEFLAARPHLTEVNFWIPSGGPAKFGRIAPGEPMLFKTHYPQNRLVGGGFLSDYRQTLLSEAWRWFGEANGVASQAEMRVAVSRYRREPLRPNEDPIIGCAMLRDVAFLPPSEQLPAPRDFAKNLVQGKGYQLGVDSASSVELAFARLVAAAPGGLDAGGGGVSSPMFGAPRPVAPRLGQIVLDGRRIRVSEQVCGNRSEDPSGAAGGAHQVGRARWTASRGQRPNAARGRTSDVRRRLPGRPPEDVQPPGQPQAA